MSHTCHWPTCNKVVPPKLWGCRNHWFKLPQDQRDAIWANYRPGQEVDNNPSEKYLQIAAVVNLWCMNYIWFDGTAAEKEQIKRPLLAACKALKINLPDGLEAACAK